MKTEEFYKRCAYLLKSIHQKKITLKNAVYKTNNPKQYLAVIKNTMDNFNAIEKIYSHVKDEFKLEKYLSFIQIYEILAKKYKNKDKFYEVVQNFAKDINLTKYKPTATYFRINSMKISKEEVDFKYEMTEIKNVFKTYAKIDHHLVNDRKILIQNFSSCIPAAVLDPQENSTVLDVCAAPGNKTLQLSELMNYTGEVIAIEKNTNRFEVLKRLVEKSEVKNISLINADCLEIDTRLFKDAKYVLVDPSCSGSGLHSVYTKNDERLKALQTFQRKVLNHFLSLKSVDRLVYSTCSIHEEENEEVVQYALANNKDFELHPISLFNSQKGNKKYKFSDKVIRMEKNSEENIVGFFVALFVRKKTINKF
ncbi:hypothetical protein H312_00123 [Anncaliia algerae PRA339]|uniref:SAM-dependent MTase RsmB/NOP-type domain-containing protein n=1 Tax=Anncaliia algerae PRA339 TaxID=1288291 RepID=A0A059F5J3_9MICR|nr:hypothetical protein H312_00123 [Anncaliia algerae PRA339]